MGYTRTRTGAAGTPRYTAYFLDGRGRTCSAGTYPTRKAANLAWQHAESLLATGNQLDPRAGQLRFSSYVTEKWLPNHVMEPTTRQSYRYNLGRHILPWFGPMRMVDILPIHVREWVVDLIARGVTPATIRHQKIILSAVFTTALNDFVIHLHPCRGVKTPTVPVRAYRILTPAEIARLLLALPNDPARLLVDTFIGTGLRWGEAVELRPADLDQRSGILTISRAVAEISPDDHPTGGRFLVKPYPKNRQSRRFKLDPTLISALQTHMATHALAPEDLLFPYPILKVAADVKALSAPTGEAHRTSKIGPSCDTTDPGLTEPNFAGRRYPHATLSAYTAGACRCPHCRAAFAGYRATRRSNGHDHPRGTRPPPSTDGHLPRNWWRTQVWYPACSAAGLQPRPRTHDLRHSHASWLLSGGADVEIVRQRLGHGSITTTGKYVHTLPSADDSALAALNRTRHGDSCAVTEASRRDDLRYPVRLRSNGGARPVPATAVPELRAT
ncbi:MAG: tyrosine-type recombinase/integrase [Geodermatophilaceae bacterium]|nr:tyrosine-type recombinase/integrase [Geodermatophilaceae bacterium]